jgi:hypothetical protein
MWSMEHSLPNGKSFFAGLQTSQSTRQMLTRFMISILTRQGRNSCMQAASALKDQPRHRAQLSRFLQRPGWRALDLVGQLTDKLLRLARPSGEYLLIVDSTMVGHQGHSMQNTYSTGNRARRPAKNRRYKKYQYAAKSCHCFVFGLLLTPEGIRVPLFKSLYTKQYAQQRGLRHRTQAQLAAQIVAEAPVPVGALVTVLGDTAFDAKVLRDACQKRGYRWIVPCNANRVLAGPRGKRPRVSSCIEQLSTSRFHTIRLSATSGKYASQRRLSYARQQAKRKTRTYYVHAEKQQVHHVGEVLLVFSSTDPIQGKAKRDATKLLMTNATNLSARQVAELYAVRWQIELFFKELKSTLGMHEYQYKNFSAVEAWLEIVLMTFVYLEWTRQKKLTDRRVAVGTKEIWARQRSHGIRQAVLIGLEIRGQRWIAARLETNHGQRALKKILIQLLAYEYRCAA